MSYYYQNYFQVPHQITYQEMMGSLGDQIMLRFLIIGIVVLIYTYWIRCGMRKEFNGNWDSYPKQLMVRIFKDEAESTTKWLNGFMDGLVSIFAIISIATWVLYAAGVN